MRRTTFVLVPLLAAACSDDGTIGPVVEGMMTDTDPSGTDTEATGSGTEAGGTGTQTIESGGVGLSLSTGGDAGTTSGAGETSETSTSSTESGASATSGAAEGAADDEGESGSSSLRLPTPNAAFDYQLGGSYEPPQGVTLVVRDRAAMPAPSLYNICYVNGFQTQPHEESWWLAEHPDLLLRDEEGALVIDPDWDEILLDIRTEASRLALAEIVGGWISQCGSDGFDAVEVDNLDTYSRSGGRIEPEHAVAYMNLLSARAHDAGIAIGQKNSTELLSRRDELGTDFAVAEECNVWDECQDYRDTYGDLVFVIEYERTAFEEGCSAFPQLSIVLRDVDLVTPSSEDYVYDGC